MILGENMKIYIEEKILEFENSPSELENILESIEITIKESSKLLSHLVVDNVEIYENYYTYLKDNINVIEKIEVITQTYKELVEDILISTAEYLRRITKTTEGLSDKFYKTPISDDWNSLKDLLTGVSWIISGFSSIDSDKNLKHVVSSYEDWNEYAGAVYSLSEAVGEFEEALSNGDNIAIADILLYELQPVFILMEEKLLNLVEVEVSSHDTN